MEPQHHKVTGRKDDYFSHALNHLFRQLNWWCHSIFFSRSLFTGLFLSRWSHGANTPQLWQLPQEWPLPRGPLLSSRVPLPNSMPSWQHTQHHRYTDCLHKSWSGIFCHITLLYPVVDIVEKCICSSTVEISSNLNIFSIKYSYIIPKNMIYNGIS